MLHEALVLVQLLAESGDDFSGVTEASLTVGNIRQKDGYRFRCIVSNSAGITVSETAIVYSVVRMPVNLLFLPVFKVPSSLTTIENEAFENCAFQYVKLSDKNKRLVFDVMDTLLSNIE